MMRRLDEYLDRSLSPCERRRVEAKVDDVPLRFLVVHKANASTEAGATPSSPALAKLLAESKRSGVLLYRETLLPSAKARRLHYSGGKRRVVDGPFGESKELIGGFSILQMRSLDEVVEWTDRYARILGGNVEVDVRPIAEPAAAEAQ